MFSSKEYRKIARCMFECRELAPQAYRAMCAEFRTALREAIAIELTIGQKMLIDEVATDLAAIFDLDVDDVNDACAEWRLSSPRGRVMDVVDEWRSRLYKIRLQEQRKRYAAQKRATGPSQSDVPPA